MYRGHDGIDKVYVKYIDAVSILMQSSTDIPADTSL